MNQICTKLGRGRQEQSKSRVDLVERGARGQRVGFDSSPSSERAHGRRGYREGIGASGGCKVGPKEPKARSGGRQAPEGAGMRCITARRSCASSCPAARSPGHPPAAGRAAAATGEAAQGCAGRISWAPCRAGQLRNQECKIFKKLVARMLASRAQRDGGMQAGGTRRARPTSPLTVPLPSCAFILLSSSSTSLPSRARNLDSTESGATSCTGDTRGGVCTEMAISCMQVCAHTGCTGRTRHQKQTTV